MALASERLEGQIVSTLSSGDLLPQNRPRFGVLKEEPTRTISTREARRCSAILSRYNESIGAHAIALQQQLGHTPPPMELARSAGLPIDTVVTLLDQTNAAIDNLTLAMQIPVDRYIRRLDAPDELHPELEALATRVFQEFLTGYQESPTTPSFMRSASHRLRGAINHGYRMLLAASDPTFSEQSVIRVVDASQEKQSASAPKSSARKSGLRVVQDDARNDPSEIITTTPGLESDSVLSFSAVDQVLDIDAGVINEGGFVEVPLVLDAVLPDLNDLAEPSKEALRSIETDVVDALLDTASDLVEHPKKKKKRDPKAEIHSDSPEQSTLITELDDYDEEDSGWLSQEPSMEFEDEENIDPALDVSHSFLLGMQVRQKKDRDRDFSPDPVSILFQEIGQHNLLTAEQEVDLAQRYEKGRNAKEHLHKLSDGTSQSGIEQLEDDVVRGQLARDRLTECNMRLVVSVARKYLGRGLPFSDLIQEGGIGLGQAVDKYDYTKGFRFSTYAYWWIRQGVVRAIANQSRTVRVPVHIFAQLTAIQRAGQKLQQNLGREPTPEEIAAQINEEIIEKNKNNTDKKKKQPNWDAKKVKQTIHDVRNPLSLETPIGNNGDGVLGELVEDTNAEDPVLVTGKIMLSEAIEAALDDLDDPREAHVLRGRYELTGKKKKTLKELAKELGVSRSRIMQLEDEGLANLRTLELRDRLKEYIEE
jgi:RNA polymerase primary sigma factor